MLHHSNSNMWKQQASRGFLKKGRKQRNAEVKREGGRGISKSGREAADEGAGKQGGRQKLKRKL